jgi:hypothetical protein
MRRRGRGQLHLLKWLREQQCPWNWATCANAAMYGHVEIMRWAREQGCPWDGMTVEYAIQRTELEAGPSRYSPPRHPTHFSPCVLI